MFIISGFLFQISFYNFSGIKDFASEYQDIFTILATVISTTLGIFLGNTILRYIDKRKEQKEIAIIFINAIDAQVKCMRHINFYLSSLRQDDPKSDEFLKIYISELSDYKGFETAFERIGIYSEREIDCISLYSTKRKQLISLTERLLLHFANPEKKEFWLEFEIVKLFVVTTTFLGLLCLIQISRFYSLEKMNNYQKDFEDFFIKRLEELNLSLPVTGRELCKGFVKRLEWLKDHYPKNHTSQIKLDKKFYICIIELDVNTINDIFNVNLIVDNYINNLNNIFSFGQSEEEAKNKVKEKLRELIKEKRGLFLSKTTSRDIQNYHNQLNTNIDNLFEQLNKEVTNITPWQ